MTSSYVDLLEARCEASWPALRRARERTGEDLQKASSALRPIGFSTGSLAKGDFRHAISLQAGHPSLRAIELSALRDHELPELAAGARQLDLARFEYVSVHAPSKLTTLDEASVFAHLEQFPESWPVIVHPELLRTPHLWRRMGARLCLENMDNRKTTGRTISEMHELFTQFPDAGFCLDLGHGRQVDPTMATAIRMLQELGNRLRQLHISEVGARGEHLPLSVLAVYAFQLVADLVPPDCPIIIESVIPPEQMDCEVQKSAQLFAAATRRQERSLGAAAAVVAMATFVG